MRDDTVLNLGPGAPFTIEELCNRDGYFTRKGFKANRMTIKRLENSINIIQNFKNTLCANPGKITFVIIGR
jgi:hypothetical protein